MKSDDDDDDREDSVLLTVRMLLSWVDLIKASFMEATWCIMHQVLVQRP